MRIAATALAFCVVLAASCSSIGKPAQSGQPETSSPTPSRAEPRDGLQTDRATEFRFVRKVMEVCEQEGIQIWKLHPAPSGGPTEVEPGTGPGTVQE